MVFKQLNVSVSITTGGSSVFNETHSVVTSSNGLISLRIGSKNPSSFSSIDWGSGSHNIEVTVSDGQGLTISTENKLLSVPYALYSGGADSSGNLSTKLDEEIARAMAAEDINATAIADEATRAKAAEAANATAIADEATRAKAAEAANATAIADEITRAKTAEAANTTAIADEETRAKTAEANNATAISAEETRAKAAEAANNHATDINADAIAAEETRAKTAEASNALAIAEEITRAKAAEAGNANTIVNERARMDGIEMELDSEIDRAKAAEATNATAIADEITRAKAAEAANATAITALQTSAVTELSELTDVSISETSVYAVSPSSSTTSAAIKNASFGVNALDALTAGFNNTAVGYNALSKVTGGDYNTAVGQGAGLNVIGGISNTFIGHNANSGTNQATPSNRTAIGAGAIATTNKSVVLGNSSVDQVWMASNKGATIYAGGLVNTGDIVVVGNAKFEGTLDVVNGALSLEGVAVTSSAAELNILDGVTATPAELNYVDGVTSNIQTQFNTISSSQVTSLNDLSDVSRSTYSVYIANTPSSLTSGNFNVGVGVSSLNSVTTGGSNTAIGWGSLSKLNTGSENDAFGNSTLFNNRGGSYNVGIGKNTLFGNTSGNGNTALGNSAGNSITTGDNNTILGYGANPNANSASNQIVIGKGATGQANNSVTLGNADVTAIYMAQDSGATVYAAGLNIGGTAVSSTAAELNILDGVTATAAELNILDGVNVSTDEINYLDGVTSSLQAQINSLNAKIESLENSSRTDEQVQDIVGAMVSGNTESKIAVTYDDDNAKLDFSVDVTSPSITGSQNVSINEGETAVQSYSASESVTWSISGTDSSKFSLTQSTGAIAFSSAPDYETPTDADANNVYALTLTATDAVGNASSVNLFITVSNVVEAFNASYFSIQGTTTTDTTAKINWTYSGDQGAPGVEGYFLWVREGRGGSWNPVTVFKQNLANSASFQSYTLTDLEPDTMYAFRLWPLYSNGTQCKNCNGTGEPLFTTQTPQAN